MHTDTLQKITYCFIPLLMEQMLLCAASVLFADMPALGLCAGHALTAVMCVLLLRRDAALGLYGAAGSCNVQGTHGMPGRRKKTDGRGLTVRPSNEGGPDHRTSAVRETGRSLGVPEVMAWAAAACLLCLLCTYLLNISGLTDADAAYLQADFVIEGAPALIRFILVVIAAPVSEELLYRGVLYQRVTACFGRKAGFLASVAAFALSHGNLSQGIAACASGILLTAACLRCGRDFCVRGQSRQDQGCGEAERTLKKRTAMRKSCAMDIAGRLWFPVLLHSVFNVCSLYAAPLL